jgi:hypothetical protein
VQVGVTVGSAFRVRGKEEHASMHFCMLVAMFFCMFGSLLGDVQSGKVMHVPDGWMVPHFK